MGKLEVPAPMLPLEAIGVGVATEGACNWPSLIWVTGTSVAPDADTVTVTVIGGGQDGQGGQVDDSSTGLVIVAALGAGSTGISEAASLGA